MRTDFLAEYHQEADFQPGICPVKGQHVNPTTGEVISKNYCERLWCPTCSQRAVARRARAIRRAEPHTFARYSFPLSADPRSVARAINRFHASLRREGLRMQAAWHMEPNPGNTGTHAHVFVHGDYLPRTQILPLGLRVGITDVYLTEWASGRGRYDYGMKMALDPLSRLTFADLNRGHLGSNTRGFWRDGANGRRLTLREASSHSLAR